MAWYANTSPGTFAFSAAFSRAYDSPEANSPVTLLDLLKLFLGISTEDDTNNPELERALDIAGSHCESYFDRIIAKRAVTERFAHHFGTVVLHNYPIDTGEALTVTIDGTADTTYSIIIDNAELGHLSRLGYRPDIPMDWRAYAQAVVTYTAGHDPIPADLADAIIYTAAAIYQADGTGDIPTGSSGDIKTMQIYDVGSVTYDTAGAADRSNYRNAMNRGIIPIQAAEILDRHRRISA